MSDSVQMPALGESVTEGTVTRWLKQVGDRVEVDEPLLEVSTDKVDTEIPSPVAGVVEQILVGEDETVEVGAQLAVIGSGQDGGGPGGQDGQQAASQNGQADGGQPAPQDGQSSGGQGEQGGPGGQADQQGEGEQPQEEGEQVAQSPQGRDDAGASGSGQGGSGQGGSGPGGTPVHMPALGESVTEGTVTRWLKQEGERVEVDEPLLEVSTDKVDTEIPSPVAGTVQRILVGEDETVEVGAELAIVGDGAAPSGDGGEAPQQQAQQPQAQQQVEQPQEPKQQDAPAQQEQARQEPAADEGESLADEAEQRQAVQDEASRTTAPGAAGGETATSAAAPQQAEPSGQQQSGAQQQQAPQQEAQQRGQEPSPRPSSDGEPSAYVTPLVRKLAAEHGVDLATVTGTGVGGRVRKQDVLDAAAKAREAEQSRQEEQSRQTQPARQADPSAPAGRPSEAVAAIAAKRGTTEKMSRLRKVIAQRMVESLQVSAQLTTVVEVDVTRVARLRQRAKADFEAREGVKLSFLPFFALATVEALKTHPTVNASLEDDTVVYHAQENLGIAVDTERGLLVPVVRDAGDLNIAGLARKIDDLAKRTRTNKITPDELGGGTFTLTNTGSRGALFDTPIINQPQVGIMGTGAVVKRPVVVADADGGESIAVRSMVYLALSYDHRLVDGADAARFLVTVKQRLEEGAFEADLGL